jgi:probable HAF family extracellular repeat protein
MTRPRITSFVLLLFKTLTCALGAIVAGTAGLGIPQQVFGQTNAYIVTDLSLDDATQVPCKLNNFGDVVGRAGGPLEGEPRATVWNRSNLRRKHLGAFSDGDYSSASDINDVGEVAGVSNTSKAMIPFIWTAKGGLQRIPLLPGDSCGQAISINKDGHIVGYSSGANGAKAFLWTRRAGVRNLGILLGGNYSRARDVNDSDEAVGISASSAGERAVLWTKTGTVRDLGTLPGDWASEAVAINNAGDVVGYSKGPRGMRAVLWTKAGQMEELGVLPGGSSSQAMDISDLGEVVGSSTSASGEHAFIWSKRAGMADLNNAGSEDLGVVFIEAHAINSKGQILVMGISAHDGDMKGIMASGDNHYCAPAPPSTFLLTPVAAP